MKLNRSNREGMDMHRESSPLQQMESNDHHDSSATHFQDCDLMEFSYFCAAAQELFEWLVRCGTKWELLFPVLDSASLWMFRIYGFAVKYYDSFQSLLTEGWSTHGPVLCEFGRDLSQAFFVFASFLSWHALLTLGVCTISCLIVLSWWVYRQVPLYRKSICFVGRSRCTQRRTIALTTWKPKFFLYLLLCDPQLCWGVGLQSCSGIQSLVAGSERPNRNHENVAEGISEMTWPTQHRTVSLFWIHGELQPLPLDLLIPRWAFRQHVGVFLGLEQFPPLWHNFEVHHVRPPPLPGEIVDDFIVVELPGDKEWQSSIILLEEIEANSKAIIRRRAMVVPFQLFLEDFISLTGFGWLCGLDSRNCFVQALGEPWYINELRPRILLDGPWSKSSTKTWSKKCAKVTYSVLRHPHTCLTLTPYPSCKK